MSSKLQTAEQIAKREARQTARRIGALGVIVFSSFWLAFTWLDLNKEVKSTTEAVSVSLAHAVSVGDRFQIHRTLASVLTRTSYEAAWVYIPEQSEALASQVGDSEFVDPLAQRVVFVSGKVFWLASRPITDEQGIERARLVLALSLPVGRFLLNILAIVLLVAFVSLLLNRSYIRLSAKFTRPIQKLASEISAISPESTTLEFADDPAEIAETRNVLERFRDFWTLIQEQRQRENELLRQAVLAETAKQVAHDIRSPVSALRIFLRTTEGLDSESQNLLRTVIDRIQSIAEDFRGKSKMKKVDLSKLVQEIVLEKKVEFSEYHDVLIKDETPISDHKPIAYIEPYTLKRIISNLFNNAMEAKKADKALEIKVAVNIFERIVVIEVEDDGKGIAPDVLQMLTAGTKVSASKSEGSGLGLSMARKKLSEWGGELLIESVYGVRTKVSLRVPL